MALAGTCLIPLVAHAQFVIPGTGQKVTAVGDDFEDPEWSYIFNLPKSSEENDEQRRFPSGQSSNGRWFEGLKRGQPDVIKRVPTPEGGLAGSEGALLMVSRQTGIPGRYSHQMQQDDFIVNVRSRVRGAIPVSRSPSVVVRVYLPPWEEWEERTGPSFGFRAACLTHKNEKKKRSGFFGGTTSKRVSETYWPGMFIQFNRGDGDERPDSAVLIVRGGSRGHDFRGPKIEETGWWTLGMSFTPNGAVHYFARPGVEDLTASDHISSQYPYSYRCEHLDTFFFNVCSGDNGHWSTPWIIDNAELYISGSYATRSTRTR
ncbi:MAG: hypothetical protein DWQ37_00390 [Planctomycetota bacterium]|nr:MAG: hypothetical protein DWQ37_00390 [Planctomycetota bacterium]